MKTLNGGVDPLVGKATQIQPGEVRNPGGRPKSKLISEGYRALLATEFPGDPKHRTYAELIAEGQARAAIKGRTDAAKEIADRVEGKATQPVELTGEQGAPISLNLNVRFVDTK